MAQTALRLIDETPKGEVLHEVHLTIASEKISARDVITRRVREEVSDFNSKTAEEMFRGLVQPTDTDAELNGYKLRRPRLLDAEAQCAEALRAFESNGFFMLADGKQVESLDEEIVVTPGTKVSFVKLVPLVGG